MRAKDRADIILAHVEKKGFVSVKELSDLCQVTEMTIRRDLQWLEEKHRVRRTHGGAVPERSLTASVPERAHHNESVPERSRGSAGLAERSASSPVPESTVRLLAAAREDAPLVDRIDVLVAAAPITKYERILTDSQGKKILPIVAESTPLPYSEVCVSVDNYEAGRALGQWSGRYAREHWNGKAGILDLTYHLINTQERSQGFIAGVREILPDAQVVLSINTQSHYEMAYQLTRDALAVHKNINIIFAMNDTSALGALHASQDLKIDPNKLIVLPFGLEGGTMRQLLLEGGYCQAGLAMFPEIVGPVCVEAAIDLWNQRKVGPMYTTPFAVLTSESLGQFYTRDASGWHLRWDQFNAAFTLPVKLAMDDYPLKQPRPQLRPQLQTQSRPLPRRIGFVYTFVEHEWYHSLIDSVRDYTERLGMELDLIDAEQTMKDEIDWRRHEIARSAAAEIEPEESVSIDSGPICSYLADLLRQSDRPITVITNSVTVLDLLASNPNITLISTGGVLRRSSMTLVGPTAESTLRDIRVDKLFLNVNGMSLDFGLSHNNLSEVTIKQAMIRSAREVILLADHTCFGQEAFIQVAPVTAIHQIITDDALPASVRLELSKLGIRVELASA